MRFCRVAFVGLLIACVLPTTVWAQTSDGPSNRAVLLPPQWSDTTAKTANTTRERYGEWSISGGVYLMQPVFDSNPAFIVRGGGNIARQIDFSHHLDVSPNVWLGYVSERGWGFRGRWFQFDQGGSASYFAAPGESIAGISPVASGRLPIGGTVTASSNLAVNVIDIEATGTLEMNQWSHLLGIGVRYTHMSQDYRATLADANTRIDLTSGHNLNGAGPSFSLETKRRIGESGFAVYGQLHGAIVFGHASEAYSTVNNGIPQQLTRGHSDILPVGEMEVGAEYQRNVGRAKLFLQAGFVGQVWLGGGNASNLAAAGFSASNSNFGFLGLALRAGVRY